MANTPISLLPSGTYATNLLLTLVNPSAAVSLKNVQMTVSNFASGLFASPTLTGTPVGPTASSGTNTTQLATTAFVLGQAGSSNPYTDGTASAGSSFLYSRQDHVHPTDASRAPLASPTFTGTVTIPSGASISGFAPLASPTFTGVPAGPTATYGTNTTQFATTAFVQSSVGNMDAPGTVSTTSTVSSTSFGSLIKVTAASITITIQTPVGNSGCVLEFYGNFSSGTSTITTPAGTFTGPVGSTTTSQKLGASGAIWVVSDGANWLTFNTSNAPGSITYTSSGSGSIPPWAKMFRIVGVGGGGSGAGGGTVASSGSGGGSGGTAVKAATEWTPVSALSTLSYTVTIGAGGTAVAAGANGTGGGNTTVAFGSLSYLFSGSNQASYHSTAGSSGAASLGGGGGSGNFNVIYNQVLYAYNSVVTGGLGSSATGVPNGQVYIKNGPTPGGAGGGLNAGTGQAGGNGNFQATIIATASSSGPASGGATAGAAGANGYSATNWPLDYDGSGGGGGAGNGSGVGGNGGSGGQPGGGGGGGGSGTTGGGTGGAGGAGAAVIQWV